MESTSTSNKSHKATDRPNIFYRRVRNNGKESTQIRIPERAAQQNFSILENSATSEADRIIESVLEEDVGARSDGKRSRKAVELTRILRPVR